MPEELFSTTLTDPDPKKHSVRYDNHDNLAPIRSLYINKVVLPSDYPETITVSVGLPDGK